MNNREPSWRHMLWIVPSVIVTEALMVLGANVTYYFTGQIYRELLLNRANIKMMVLN